MKIKSIRQKEELADVLMTTDNSGPGTAYWVFENVSAGKWKNLTILVAGRYGQEYPKTYGHYHTSKQKFESSKIIAGEGIFILQKKFYDESGKWVPNKVEAVYLIHAEPGDEMIYVPQDYAHSWSNIGSLPLMTYDDWVETGEPTHTYDEIEKLQGLAVYLVENQNGQPQAIPNKNYINLPDPNWVTPEEFNYLSQNK